MRYLISRKRSYFETGDSVVLCRSKKVITVVQAPPNGQTKSGHREPCHYVVNPFDPAGRSDAVTAPYCDMAVGIFKMIRVEEAMGGAVSLVRNHLVGRLVMDPSDIQAGARFYLTTDKAKIVVDAASRRPPRFRLRNENPKHDENGTPIGPYTDDWWADARTYTRDEVLQRINDANPKKLVTVTP